MTSPNSYHKTRDHIPEDSLLQYAAFNAIKSEFTHLSLWQRWSEWFVASTAGAEVRSEQLPGLHRLLKEP